MTVALLVNVKVQVGVSLSPVEQAPDQTAMPPFETLSVTIVPTANDADVEAPDDTLIPAGLDVTLPCRPVTLTVSVAAV